MSIQIDVKYKDKEEAKELGAKWDTELKTWYIPNGTEINAFGKWLPNDCCFIRSPFTLIESSRDCWKCGKRSPVITIGTEKVFKTIKERHSELKARTSEFQIFFYVRFLPKQITDMIQEHFPTYRYTFSRTLNIKYWANTCKYCKILQGDNELHQEVDSPFDPIYGTRDLKSMELTYKHDFPIVGDYDRFKL